MFPTLFGIALPKKGVFFTSQANLWLFSHMLIVSVLCFLFFFCALGCGQQEDVRPQFVRGNYAEHHHFFLGSEYEYLQTELEFDQPLYLNEPFLCAAAELSCPPLDCIPCDWSDPEANNCQDERCCVPSFPPMNKDLWCSGNSSFTRLKVNEKSETFTLDAGETQFFRFFVGEEAYCHPILVTVRPIYGNHFSFLSSTTPNPDWSNHQPTGSLWRENIASIGQSYYIACPHWNGYTPGTYSLGVTAYEATSFYVEIAISPKSFPLDPPLVVASCDNIPQENLDLAEARDLKVLCLEDGKTTHLVTTEAGDFVDEDGNAVTLILPVPEGCHSISVGFQNFPGTYFGRTDYDLFCFANDSPLLFRTAGIGLWMSGGDTLSFFGCFPEVAYINCLIEIWHPGNMSVIYSTVSPFHRTALTELPDATLSYYFGMGSHSAIREGSTLCATWHMFCSNWLVTATSNPLTFWPPPFHPLFPLAHYSPLPTELVSHEILGNRIIIVDATIKAGEAFGSRETQLSDGILAFFKFTNADGLPLYFPPSSNPAAAASSSSLPSYLNNFPYIFYSDLMPREEKCNGTSFLQHQQLISGLISSFSTPENTLDSDTLSYYVDLFNSQDVRSDCLKSILSAFPIENSTLIQSGYACYFEQGTEEYATDPCCNITLAETQCCPFHTAIVPSTSRKFVKDNGIICETNECTLSFLSDFVRSSNDLDNGVIGCPAVLPEEQSLLLDQFRFHEFEKIRSCLNQVGFGELFHGVTCIQDDECEGTCDNGVCSVKNIHEIDDAFLACYIDNLIPFIEDYIRRKVFAPHEQNYARSSTEFFDTLKKYATVGDCVSLSDPFDLSQRRRIIMEEGSLSCSQNCLGNFFCLFEPACKFGDFDFRLASYEQFAKSFISSPETCGGASCSNCVVESQSCGLCIGGVDPERCIQVEGRSSQEECEIGGGGGCVAPNGTIYTNLTKEECDLLLGECSIQCQDERCVSQNSMNGVCVLLGHTQEECLNLNGTTWESSTCLFEELSESECQETLQSWQTCDNHLDSLSCSSSSPASIYLNCQWRNIPRPCTTKEECEEAAECSDSSWLHVLESGKKGGCFSPGSLLSQIIPVERNRALYSSGSFVGYLSDVIFEKEECIDVGYFWIDAAENKEECLENVLGRFGCLLPRSRYRRFFFYDEEQCECKKGFYRQIWSWNTGQWKTSEFIPFQWIEEQPPPLYEWIDSLSYFTVESWIVESTAERTSLSTLSSLNCQHNFTSSTLNWLVCDCLSDEMEECENPPPSSKVGFGRACSGLPSTFIIPSTHLIFQQNSLKEGCVNVELSFLSRDGYTFIRSNPTVSVKFEDPQTSGIVVNQRGVTVGSLVGDGVEIELSFESFSQGFSSLNSVEICMFIRSEQNVDWEAGNLVPDFGMMEDQETVRVLNADLTNQSFSGHEFWCLEIKEYSKFLERSRTGTVIFFPISRQKDSSSQDIYSDQAKILAWVLSGFYCILFILFSLLFLFNLTALQTQMGVFVPLFFVLLCSFRASFFILWPLGELEDDQVVEYFLFETPTFILFGVLLLLIYYWTQLQQQGKASIIREVFFAFCLLLLYIGMIVALILIWEDDSGTSPCPGRYVEDDSSLEDNLRILSLVYTSIVTLFTILLVGTLGYEARALIQKIANGFGTALFYIPASRFAFIFLCFFVLRCILFLVLYATNIVSDIFIFILLFICEIIPCSILFVEIVLASKKDSSLTASDHDGSTGMSVRTSSRSSLGRSRISRSI